MTALELVYSVLYTFDGLVRTEMYIALSQAILLMSGLRERQQPEITMIKGSTSFSSPLIFLQLLRSFEKENKGSITNM